MREITLTRGQIALIDDDDWDLVTQFKWRVFCPQKIAYAVSQISRAEAQGKNRTIRMHTLIAGPGLIDHRNGNGLDNRRSNLRPATTSENCINSRGWGRTYGYRGVGFQKGRWRAYIGVAGKQVTLGRYDTKEDAARAYDRAALMYYGEFAHLNFPLPVDWDRSEEVAFPDWKQP